MAEFGCCHRNEAHGALHGLLRVRQMTQDDAHIFCTEEQIQAETEKFVHLLYSVYEDMGFADVVIKLATRPEKFGGTIERWNAAEKALGDALRATGYDFVIAEGEGAFYAPKLEFHLKDAIGRSWQVGTLQLDYVLPERLDATYVAEDGSRKYAGDAAPRDPRLARALHRHDDRELRRQDADVAGADAGGGRDHRLGRRRLCRKAGDAAQATPASAPSSTCATRRSTTRCASTRCRRCR